VKIINANPPIVDALVLGHEYEVILFDLEFIGGEKEILLRPNVFPKTGESMPFTERLRNCDAESSLGGIEF